MPKAWIVTCFRYGDYQEIDEPEVIAVFSDEDRASQFAEACGGNVVGSFSMDEAPEAATYYQIWFDADSGEETHTLATKGLLGEDEEGIEAWVVDHDGYTGAPKGTVLNYRSCSVEGFEKAREVWEKYRHASQDS